MKKSFILRFTLRVSAFLLAFGVMVTSQSMAAKEFDFIYQQSTPNMVEEETSSNKYSSTILTDVRALLGIPTVSDIDPKDYMPDSYFEFKPEAITSEDMSKNISRFEEVTVIDLETGKDFKAVQYGFSGHLDAEPKSEEDAQVIESLEGYSWNRRAVAIIVDDVYYAASMNTMPHGGSNVGGNNFAGHFCIHFVGSKTNGSNIVCPLHQEQIRNALSTNLFTVIDDTSILREHLNEALQRILDGEHTQSDLGQKVLDGSYKIDYTRNSNDEIDENSVIEEEKLQGADYETNQSQETTNVTTNATTNGTTKETTVETQSNTQTSQE